MNWIYQHPYLFTTIIVSFFVMLLSMVIEFFTFVSKNTLMKYDFETEKMKLEYSRLQSIDKGSVN
jgi:hypothetical protein